MQRSSNRPHKGGGLFIENFRQGRKNGGWSIWRHEIEFEPKWILLKLTRESPTNQNLSGKFKKTRGLQNFLA